MLVTGWLFALPVPFLVIYAPTWEWVAANVLLGVNQGLAWSMTVIMKIDLVGPVRRGLAMGLNEAAGYLAASYALRPAPFLLGIAFAVDDRNRRALAAYQSIFQAEGDRLLTLYEAEDQYYGRMLGGGPRGNLPQRLAADRG